MRKKIRLVECPRDAMQGWKSFIPTEKKVAYQNALLQAGFDTIDFGSFVSPKAIPQMADTAEVITKLNLQNTKSHLLAIIANTRGAEEALLYESIDYLGFPFSVSQTFQQRNTNASIADALERVKEIQKLCSNKNKQLVIYISMGFGNPYGDPFSEELVFDWVEKIVAEGIGIISLADTVGVATPDAVNSITSHLVKALPDIEIGVHLHSTSQGWHEKLVAAYDAGATRFDGALKGIGGCPMAKDDLVGNMNTEWLLQFFKEKGVDTGIDETALKYCLQLADEIFV
ncbi:MAG: hydroxymethylglutaryl-CoA lyase [Flaviaesturariibacter sp.]|nr:hydroxymethylglutaryl-CoA lyase [Flaviaesturariibacter sp.]